MSQDTYEVTDPVSGETLEFTGPRQPNEQEMQEAFASLRKAAAMSVTPPANPLENVKQLQRTRPDILGDVASRMPSVDPMEVVGGLGQRFESIASSVPSAITQGENPFTAYGDAWTGKRQFEFGDPLARRWGAPELVSGLIGLGASTFADPVAIGIGAVGRMTAMLGEKSMTKMWKSMWTEGAQKIGRLSEEGARFAMLEDKLQWLDPKVMKGDPFRRGLVYEHAGDVAKDVGEKFYRPSSEAWNAVQERAKHYGVNPDVIEEIMSRLDEGLSKSGDKSIFKRMVNYDGDVYDGEVSVGKLNEMLDRAKASLGKSGETGSGVTLDELIEVQKDFASQRNNIAARYASTMINEVLGTYAPELLGDAIKKSHNMNLSYELLDKIGIGAEKTRIKTPGVSGKGLAAMEIDKGASKQSRLLHIFDDEKKMAEEGLQQLQELYGDNKADYSKLTEAVTGIKRANITYALRSKAAQGGNISRLAALPTAFATAAILEPLVGKPSAYAAGALAGGYAAMTQTSPRAFANLANAPEKMRAWKAKPMVRLLSEIHNRVQTGAAANFLTGRERLKTMIQQNQQE